MGDVGVELGPAFGIERHAILRKLRTTLVAILRPEVILHPAPRAVGCEFAAGHRNKGAVRAVDDLEISTGLDLKGAPRHFNAHDEPDWDWTTVR